MATIEEVREKQNAYWRQLIHQVLMAHLYNNKQATEITKDIADKLGISQPEAGESGLKRPERE